MNVGGRETLNGVLGEVERLGEVEKVRGNFLSEKGVNEGGTANCKEPMEMNKLLRATGPSPGESISL